MSNPIFGDAADRLLRGLARHRERYVRAWCAATGLHPRECILEERILVDGDAISARSVAVRRAPDAAEATIADLRDGLTDARQELQTYADAETVAEGIERMWDDLRAVDREVADLRDRLALLSRYACDVCGCAPVGTHASLCGDCCAAIWAVTGTDVTGSGAAACAASGLRALCGRRLAP